MADERENTGGEVAMGCLLMVIMLPIAIALRAYVLAELWDWFVVPLGVSAITLWHAYGLAALVSLMTGNLWPAVSDKKESMTYQTFKMAATCILAPLLAWFIGWCSFCAQRGVWIW